jgi:galactonate dehydratase
MANALLLRRARLQSILPLQTRAVTEDPLAIRGLRLWQLREPASGRRYSILRLDTQSGMKGYGECRETSSREVSLARSVLDGLPASAYEIAWRRLADAPGIRAAVNMAQLDIIGQAAKAPVYQVLGGPTRAKARAYAPLTGAAALERAQKAGFKAFAVSAPEHPWRNAGKSYIASAALLMRRLRRAAGDGNDFILDGAARLVPGDAQSLAAELEAFHLLWFDEPCALANLGAVRKIASENVTPLGFGRHLRTGGDFQDLLREDAVDLLRPDLAVHGISAIRRIAAIAETYYVAVAPYHDGGPLATAAALHLAASIPNFFIQQVPFPPDEKDRAMRREIAPVEAVSAGFASLPTGPGLGVRINEQVLDRYQERA